ncbi:MAG: GlsB/YeaQ/YmgE family stress response membrane protein [Actinobacteria bacterium]|nr:GlsB/YeaQ/YmgE family stress response membrane protein [Actinomycetota bacterium]
MAAILSLLVSGLIVGALARFALPGKDSMPIWMTILLGIAGSMLGGLVAAALGARSGDVGTYFVAALAGAMLLLYLHRRFVQKRPLTGPGAS